MSFVSIENEMPVFSPEAREIEVFNKILRRLRPVKGDTDGRKKLFNTKELAYVYFMSDYKSDYLRNYDDESRSDAVAEAVGIYALDKNWKPDALHEDAIEYWTNEQSKAPSLGSLIATLEALRFASKASKALRQRLEKQLDIAMNQDPSLNAKGAVVDPVAVIVAAANELIKLSTSLNTSIKNLSTLEAKVKVEMTDAKAMKGQGEKNLFEDDDPT